GPTSTVLSFPVNSTGAYTLIVHNTVFSGLAPSEKFTGEVELHTILPNQVTPTISVKIPTGTLSGIVRIPVNITGVGLTSSSYSIDSSPPKELGSETFIEVDTTSLSDGMHTLIVQTTDLVGHEATEKASFTVLNQSPSTFIGNPTERSVVNGLLNVTFRASGDLITAVTLSIDSESFSVTSQGSYVWNTTGVKDGEHTVTLSAQNAAGKDSRTVVNFSTNNQALAEERARQFQELRVVNTELTLAVAALVVSIIALAVVATRKRG
ncbi:MAG: Ig-like domain-containing protein, partial [Thaumarchaeota archaeon]|nr:Ig-like domain-containing protein [Nitrososphaerota archaeon]